MCVRVFGGGDGTASHRTGGSDGAAEREREGLERERESDDGGAAGVKLWPAVV